jgi:hypothetical protein
VRHGQSVEVSAMEPRCLTVFHDMSGFATLRAAFREQWWVSCQ